MKVNLATRAMQHLGCGGNNNIHTDTDVYQSS